MTRPSDALAGLRLLLVEDNDDTREILGMLLTAHGATVTAVGSVPEALAWLDRHRPDCLVSDIALPGRDGLSLIRELRGREARERVPAVAVTARVGSDDRRLILAAGFDVHVPKPVEIDALVRAVLRVVVRDPAGC